MTLLLDPAHLDERRAIARGALAPLATSLAADLAPLVATLDGEGPWVPPEKARMTRTGGRCAKDGVLLDFDPWDARRHRCPRCGAVYEGDDHYRWWIVGRQLWLAERAVHGALLHLLLGGARHAALADEILDRFAGRYLDWPNVDNVLGPTRPFFSTYLESIWLLQLCIAIDLRRAAGGSASAERAIDRVVEPSRALVAQYDEGFSNRQTWNAAALLAAARVLGDEPGARRAVLGPHGVAAHLEHGLLVDGSWYEGENYHLFAHRALWYGVTLAARADIELPAPLLARFDEGFAVPFLTALPDFTFPARRDSQWAVSLRQWRFAELCELGLARGDDARLVAALRTLYDPDVPAGDTTRARSTAETERNAPATRLRRADLGWRSLLHARAALPEAASYVAPPASVLLEGQGLAVLRREGGRVWAGLDYGHSGGGHGHPDRLNLVLVDGATRWLDDVGTGSYTERTLFWYRSTLAHQAPLVDGRSQERVHGHLVAFEERGGAGWVEAVVDDAAPGVSLTRTVVVMPDYLVDVVAWRAAEEVTVDVPMHADGELQRVEAWITRELAGGDAPEDGFAFVRDAEVTYAATEEPVWLDAVRGDARARAWLLPSGPAEWWRAVAPGPPSEGERRFHLTRMAGERGSLVTVWSWRDAVREAMVEGDDVVVHLADDTRHAHRRTADGWHVDFAAHGAHSSIDLAGLREPPPPPGEELQLERAELLAPELLPVREGVLPRDVGAIVTDRAVEAWRTLLAEADWRRTEQTWHEAGAPVARVAVAADGRDIVVEVEVTAVDPCFAPARDDNPLDNEHPDVNSSGVQLYLGAWPADGDETSTMRDCAWLLVPAAAPDVRATLRASHGEPPLLTARWAPSAGGWTLRASIPRAWLGGTPQLGVHLVVNEMPHGRERRRGQLVLGGAAGEWGWLRGDREPAGQLILFDLSDG